MVASSFFRLLPPLEPWFWFFFTGYCRLLLDHLPRLRYVAFEGGEVVLLVDQWAEAAVRLSLT